MSRRQDEYRALLTEIRRVTRVRDFQRSRVYRWEWDWQERSKSSTVADLEEAQAFVAHVWAAHSHTDLRMRPPTITNNLRGSRTIGRGDRWQIQVSPMGMNRWTLCHEIAHGLVYPRGGISPRGHDPDFVRVLIELLARYDNRDVNELVRTAEEMRIKIAPIEVPGRRHYVRLYVRERRRAAAIADDASGVAPSSRWDAA